MHERKTQSAHYGNKDYLADVLRLWSCDEQRWVEASPILLRFESRDVLVSDGRAIACGVIETPSPVDASLLEALGVTPLDSVCWRRDASCAACVGKCYELPT